MVNRKCKRKQLVCFLFFFSLSSPPLFFPPQNKLSQQQSKTVKVPFFQKSISLCSHEHRTLTILIYPKKEGAKIRERKSRQQMEPGLLFSTSSRFLLCLLFLVCCLQRQSALRRTCSLYAIFETFYLKQNNYKCSYDFSINPRLVLLCYFKCDENHFKQILLQ